MDKYTFNDIIINPEDPRIEVGAEYYFGSHPTVLVNIANVDANEGRGTLEEVRGYSPSPFKRKRDLHCLDHNFYTCIIRAREPRKKKLVPFDFNDPNDRDFLRGKWIRNTGEKDEPSEGQIVGFYYSTNYDEVKIETGDRISLNAKELLANCEFLDGSPCGKGVEE